MTAPLPPPPAEFGAYKTSYDDKVNEALSSSGPKVDCLEESTAC